MATLLGFLDDIFDIRWRHKLPIPIIASIPLLIVYYAEQGNTNVVVPLPLRFIFGALINLGNFSRLSSSLLYLIAFFRAFVLRLYGIVVYLFDE